MEVFNIDAKVVYEGFKAVVLRDEFEKACMDVALDALRKQIPKKIVFHDNEGNKCLSSRCPRCFEVVNSDYCMCCGQAIDRSGEDVTADC